jgi:hypothetical protein
MRILFHFHGILNTIATAGSYKTIQIFRRVIILNGLCAIPGSLCFVGQFFCCIAQTLLLISQNASSALFTPPASLPLPCKNYFC